MKKYIENGFEIGNFFFEARERCKWKAITDKSEDVGSSCSVVMERMARKKEQKEGKSVRKIRGKERRKSKKLKKEAEGKGQKNKVLCGLSNNRRIAGSNPSLRFCFLGKTVRKCFGFKDLSADTADKIKGF